VKNQVYCADCGSEITNDTKIPISYLPVDVTSANAGESAVLCRRCHVDMIERAEERQEEDEAQAAKARLEAEFARIDMLAVLDRITAERDEARKLYCRMVADLRSAGGYRPSFSSPETVASEMGWNCYEEDES